MERVRSRLKVDAGGHFYDLSVEIQHETTYLNATFSLPADQKPPECGVYEGLVSCSDVSLIKMQISVNLIEGFQL